MHRFVTSVRWLLIALLAIPGLATTGTLATAAQRESVDSASYESELSGIEIEIDGDGFEIYEAEIREYRHGRGEIVEIASNTSYIQVSFFDDTDTNQETLEIYNGSFADEVDEFEVLDEGEDGDTVFTFAVASYNGVEFYYYLAVTEDVVDNVDVLQRIFATDSVFFEDLADAQDAISIGRNGFLEDVDVDELEELAGEGRTREEPTEDPEEEPVEDPEEEATEEPVEEPTEEPIEEPVPTIDPAGATVRDLILVDAEFVAGPDVQVGQGGADPPGYEEIPMRYGQGEAHLILLMRPYSPEATLDTVLSVFAPEGGTMQNLGTDATRTSAWSLDLVESPSGSYMLYSHVQSDRFERYHFAEILFTPVDSFTEHLEGFSQNVQIGGVPMFHEADRETIEWLLGGGAEPDTRNDEQEPEDEKEEIGDNGQGSGEVDLESLGLVADDEYVSPQYGVAVEWDDSAWFVDMEWEFSASSDSETGVDSVILFRSDDDASLVIQVMPSGGLEPEVYVEDWASDDYVAEAVHEDAEVLLADSGRRSGAVLYLSYDAEGNEIIVLQEAIIIDDDVVAIVVMYTTPPVVADAYADAEDFISVDGNDAAGTFTAREIERAVDP